MNSSSVGQGKNVMLPLQHMHKQMGCLKVQHHITLTQSANV